jgi:hypothetical protein
MPIFDCYTFFINKEKDLLINVSDIRWLNPYNKNLWWLEKLKLIRILKEMTMAPKRIDYIFFGGIHKILV